MMQHIDPVGAQLHEQIKGRIGRLVTIGFLSHKAAELGRPGDRIERIPAIGTHGDQTGETGGGKIGTHRIPQGGQLGQAGGQLGCIAGAIEHQIEGMQIRLCTDPGLGFHFSLQRHG
ncbi:hypothetical protein D3C85_922700 [compost metagenome]